MRSIFLTVLLSAVSVPAWAGEEQLNMLENAVIEHQRSQPPTFNSTPVNHITPKFNKITLALDSQVLNTYAERNSSSNSTYEELQLNGYSLSPYLALSLKNIGLGIAGEMGEKGAKYTAGYNSRSYSTRYSEQSKLDYTGIGVYFYSIMFATSRNFRLTLIGGTKLLNVKHQARSSYSEVNGTTNASMSPFETIKYTVQKMELGLNLRFQLSRDLAIIPWADISVPNTSQVEDQIKMLPSGSSATVSNPRRYAADVELFWRNRNELLYGIDVAVKYDQLEFRIGSGIGFLSELGRAASEQGDYLIDDSLTVNISLSYDLKG